MNDVPQYATQTQRQEPPREFGVVAQVASGKLTATLNEDREATEGKEITGVEWKAYRGFLDTTGALRFNEVGKATDKAGARSLLTSAGIPSKAIGEAEGEFRGFSITAPNSAFRS